MLPKIILSCARRPWLTILVWVVIVCLSGYFIKNHLGSALTTSQEFTNNPESQVAGELLEQHFPSQTSSAEFVIINSEKYIATDLAYKEFATKLVTDIRQNNHVEGVVSFYEQPNPNLVSTDKKALLIPVDLASELSEQEDSVGEIIEVAKQSRNDSFDVKVAGPATIGRNFTELSEADLRKGELYGLPVTLVILIIVFGAVVAALIPVLLSIIAIAAAVGVTAIVGSQLAPISFFVVNMITMMGLAVGIDYSLFVISRFREERSNGLAKVEAIEKAGNTAGRAVLFSGMTVVLALFGLYLIPMNIFQGLASGAIFVVVLAVLASLTLLPAILGLLGDKINLLRIGRERSNVQSSFWDNITNKIIARPVASLILAVGFLLLLAAPALDLRIGSSGISSVPSRFEARQGYDLLKEKFSVGLIDLGVVVLDGGLNQEITKRALANFQQTLETDPDFGPSVVTPSPDGAVAAVRFPINAPSTSDDAHAMVKKLRQDIIPAAFGPTSTKAYLGGDAANSFDFVAIAHDNTFRVFAFVLGLSFLLLMLVFRSIVVPIKALVMNLLSVTSTYGLLVLVFQKGIGNELFGFTQVDKIEPWLPLFLFCVLFGLSMDYHVFLLSRIREHFVKSGNNTASVAFGLRSTASLITGAALIMVTVFAAFASGELVMFQQMGFGLGIAILLDATIVRTFLVPASMHLLGDRNWYLPPFLRWLPRISVE